MINLNNGYYFLGCNPELHIAMHLKMILKNSIKFLEWYLLRFKAIQKGDA